MTPDPAAGLAEGLRRRTRPSRRAPRRGGVPGPAALLLRLPDAGTATADDVRAAVPLPDGIGPRCFGAAPLQLADRGIIHAAGYTPPRRPEGHARPITLWRW